MFEDIAEVPVTRAARVYESGWQSWSPAGAYAITDRSPRAATSSAHRMGYRTDTPAPAGVFQGEGLLALESSPDGPTELWSGASIEESCPSIRAEVRGGAALVSADGRVHHRRFAGPLHEALAGWADELTTRMQLPAIREQPAGWCPWYNYFTDVTADAIVENVAAMERYALDIGLVSLDDGYQPAVGDWLVTRERFGDLAPVVAEIRGSGRRAGIWVAPFLVTVDSDVARRHSDWLIADADPGVNPNWRGRLAVLDTTRADVREHLHDVFTRFREMGFTHYKLDFLFAGAISGRRSVDCTAVHAYRDAMRLIRQAVGDEATITGSGAPLLPSIGLVDAMRVGPDTDPEVWDPPDADPSQPSMLAAIRTGRARDFCHGRYWANDPDAIVVREQVAHRERWAEHLRCAPGVATSADDLAALDPRGLELTRELLRSNTTTPWPATPIPTASPYRSAVAATGGV